MIEEKPSLIKKNFIYCYEESHADGLIKIGQASTRDNYSSEETVKQRVKESNGQFIPHFEYFEVPSFFAKGKFDNKIHKLFCSYYGTDRKIKSGIKLNNSEFVGDETFKGTFEEFRNIRDLLQVNKFDIDKSINDAKEKSSITFVPTIHQAWKSACLKDYVNNNKHEDQIWSFLYLCARFGKTLFNLDFSYWLKDAMGCKLFIVSSAWLSANSSHEKEYETFKKSFPNSIYVSWEDDNFVVKIKEALSENKKVFCDISLHAKNKMTKRIKFIKSVSKKDKALFVDEADFAACSDIKSRKVFDLGCKFNFMCSGTGIEKLKRKYSGGLIECHYSDLLLIQSRQHKIFREEYLKSLDIVHNKYEWEFCNGLVNNQEELNYYRGHEIVKPQGFMLKMPQVVSDKITDCGGKYTTDYNDIIGNVEEYEEEICAIVAGPRGCGDYKNDFRNFNINKMWDVNIDGPKPEVIGFMDSWSGAAQIKDINKIEKLYIKYLGSKYIIGKLTSENTSNKECEEFSKELYIKAKEEGKLGFIIITRGMGYRSFSNPHILYKFNFFDSGNKDNIEQGNSRVLTPGKLDNGNIKKSGKIIEVSLNPTENEFPITFSQILTMAEKAKLPNESLLEAAERVLKGNMFDFFEMADHIGFVKVSYNSLIENLLNNYEMVKKTCLLNYKEEEGDRELFKKSFSLSKSCINNNNSNSEEKENNVTNKKEDNNNKSNKKEDNDFRERLEMFLSMPIQICCSSYSRKEIEEKYLTKDLNFVKVFDLADSDYLYGFGIVKEDFYDFVSRNNDMLTTILYSQINIIMKMREV